MRPGMLQVVTDRGAWLVGVGPTTMLTVRGTAEPAFLRVGQFVRFEAEFDSEGAPVSPVTEITIFTPRGPADLGVSPAQGGFAAEPDPEQAEAAPAETASSGTMYIIGGKLTGLKNNEIQVNAGRNVKAPLAEDLKIQIEVADLSLISKGDKVSAEGTYTVPGQLVAQEVAVEMQKPLTAPPAKVGRKSRAEKAAEAEAEAEGELADDGKAAVKKRSRPSREKPEPKKRANPRDR